MRNIMLKRWVGFGCLMLFASTAALWSGCRYERAEKTAEFQPEILPIPPQLPNYEAMRIPSDNPMTPEKIALGRQLFFDTRLSADGSRACYSCHVNEHGLTDGRALAIGALGKQLPRHSPTLWNIGYHPALYWDGRSPTLEKQAMAAWTGGNMGAKADEITTKINAMGGYRSQFQKVFGGDATPDRIVQAISAFERTIIGGNTAWDRWKAGDQSAIGEEAKRGWTVFQDGKCNNCHDGVLFTDFQYHNVGIGMDKTEPDSGRANVTNRPEDTGAFKTPTLRDIARSAPYFHDGSVATLEQAVDYMIGGGRPNQWLDRKNLHKVKLTQQQKGDLLAFLRSLTVETQLVEPRLPEK